MPPQNQNVPTGPAPQAPQGPNGRYDFFMAPQQNQKSKIALPGSFKSRIILVIGGIILLVILFSVISSLLNGGPSVQVLQTAVAQDQQEIIRLSQKGSNTASAAVAQNFAITTQFTLTSAQQDLVAYLGQSGIKLDAKKLGLKQNPKSDQTLATALSAGVYDQTFTQVMTINFNTYLADLNVAYKKTKGTNGRKLLRQDYASAQVLMKQLKNLPSQ
jgi:hypothetical protein